MSLSEPFPPRLAGFHCDAHCPLKSTQVRQDKPLEPNGIQEKNPSSASALYVPLLHSPSKTANLPRRTRRQLDKELISSRRELNSFLSGMEYRSHSGAKRRPHPAPAAPTAAHGPRTAPTLHFQQVNAAATGIGGIAHNCFIFIGCHIATRKRLIFRACWL